MSVCTFARQPPPTVTHPALASARVENVSATPATFNSNFYDHATRTLDMAVPKSKGGPGATGAHEVWFGGAWRLLVLSLVFHSVYLSSIFDIYFKSPVTEGVAHRFRVARDGAVGVDEVGHALAKRVVLIVGK